MPEDPSKGTNPDAQTVSVDNAASAERRHYPRFALTVKAEVVELESGARIAGRVSDLGPGGCYVDTINPLPVGTTVKVLLTHAERTLESQAVVVYAHEGIGMGLAFVALEPVHLEVLRDWMGELSGESAPPSDAAPQAGASQPAQQTERQVLSQLIHMLAGKRVLTESEEAELLRKLSR